jgi:hypothetical protein
VTLKLGTEQLPYRWSELAVAASSSDPARRMSAVTTAGSRLQKALERAGFKTNTTETLMLMARAAARRNGWIRQRVEWAIDFRNQVVHEPWRGVPPATECSDAVDIMRQSAMDLGTDVDVEELPVVVPKTGDVGGSFMDHVLRLDQGTGQELASWMANLPPNRRVEFVSLRDRISSPDVLRTLVAQRGTTPEETTEKRFAYLHMVYGRPQSISETLMQGMLGIDNHHTRALEENIATLGQAFDAQGRASEARSEELRRKYGDSNDARVEILKYVVAFVILIGALIYMFYH